MKKIDKWDKFVLVCVFLFILSNITNADWVRVANYTTGPITNNVYICNSTQCPTDWSFITNTPTTLAGYNISDAYTKTFINNNFYPLNTNPAGYLTIITSQVFNYSSQINSLNQSINTKLNITDQRYNDTALINSETNSRIINDTYLQNQINSLNISGSNGSIALFNILNQSKVDKTAVVRGVNSPIFINGLTFDDIQDGFNISMPQANDSTGGFLSAQDHTYFGSKLNSTDQRYNETSLINTVNTTGNIEGLGFNITTDLKTYFDTLYYSITNPQQFVNNTVNNLVYYYLKTEVYNKTEIDAQQTNQNNTINSLISSNSSTNSRIDNLNSTKLIDVTSSNTYIAVSGTLNKTITFQESVLNTTISNALTTTYYNATSVQNITGIDGSPLSSIQVYDDIPFNITEVSSSYQVVVNFSNITKINQIVIRYKTIIGETHTANVMLFDCLDNNYEGYSTLGSTNGLYNVVSIGVFDSSNHVCNNTVMLLLNLSGGNPPASHLWQYDWVTVSNGPATSSGSNNDPYAVHIDGSRALTNNWDAGNFNITANSFIGNVPYQPNASGWISNGSTIYTNDSPKVGIGTNVPGAKLHVNGSSEILRLEDTSSTGNPYMSFYQNGVRRDFIQDNDANDTLILASEYGDLAFKTASSNGTDSDTEYMRIKSGGNIGIGNSNPSQKVDITNGWLQTNFSTSGNGGLIIYNSQSSALSRGRITSYGNPGGQLNINVNGVYSGSGTIMNHDDANLPYWDMVLDPRNGVDSFKIRRAPVGNATSIVDLFTMNGSGLVGIGTNFPTAKLDVNGSTLIRGNMTINDRILLSQNNNVIYIYYYNSTVFKCINSTGTSYESNGAFNSSVVCI